MNANNHKYRLVPSALVGRLPESMMKPSNEGHESGSAGGRARKAANSRQFPTIARGSSEKREVVTRQFPPIPDTPSDNSRQFPPIPDTPRTRSEWHVRGFGGTYGLDRM